MAPLSRAASAPPAIPRSAGCSLTKRMSQDGLTAVIASTRSCEIFLRAIGFLTLTWSRSDRRSRLARGRLQLAHPAVAVGIGRVFAATLVQQPVEGAVEPAQHRRHDLHVVAHGLLLLQPPLELAGDKLEGR